MLRIKCELFSDNKSAPCCMSRCQISPFIKETNAFPKKEKIETFEIRKGILNCSSNLECKSCSKQYVGTTIKRSVHVLIIIKSGARKVPKVYPNKCNVYQEQFHYHFNSL